MICLRDASKVYGSRTALHAMNLTLEGPGIIGLLGPNGSGKTTTLRLIAGFFPPSRGQVLFDGQPAVEAAPPRVGYLPENAPLYDEMTVVGYLEFVARIKGMAYGPARVAVGEVMQRLSLAERSSSFIGQLSRGYRQRVGLAQALVHRPGTLLLDEPTAGLDPVQIEEARQVIREAGRTATVVMSTHLLGEVEMLCRRVVVLREGQLAGELPLQATGAGPARWRLTLRGDLVSLRGSFLERAAARLVEEPRQLEGGLWSVQVESATSDGPEPVVAAAVALGLGVRAVEPARLDLFREYARLQETGAITDAGG